MDSTIEQSVQACMARLLKPLVRLLLRYGVPYGVFADIAKRVYVNVAREDFAISGRMPSDSRASIITGLSRKEVLRVKRLPELSDQKVMDSYNRATRVISGWVCDPQFSGGGNEPAELVLEGSAKSFTALVKKYSGEVPARAILDELLRVGAVERPGNGKIKLLGKAYTPSEGEREKIAILGSEVADLVRTIDHNLQAPSGNSMLQLRVAYDNLPRESVRRFRMNSPTPVLNLLKRFDKELAAMDRDVNPDTPGTGRMRAGISVFYFEEDRTEHAGEAQA